MQSGQNSPQDSKGPDSKPKAPNQIPFNLYFWWLIFAGLMIWNLFTLWPRQHTVADIPYSTFLSQVRSGNVSQVHIVGDSIDGKFVKAVLWPPPKNGVEQQAQPPPSPEPHLRTPATAPPYAPPPARFAQ